MGPNFFIWMSMATVVVATVAALLDHAWAAWIGYPIAVALAIFNKVRAVRRRRADAARTFD